MDRESELCANEPYFQNLIENSPALIAVLDGAGIFQYQNPSSERVLGYRPEVLVGRNAFDFVHPQDLGKCREILAELAGATPESCGTMEIRFRHGDGSFRELEASVRKLANGSGPPSYVFDCRDTTARNRMEDSLRLAQLSVSRTVEQVHWIDREGRIVYANEASCRRDGYTAEEMLRLRVFDLDPTLTADSWNERWEHLAKVDSRRLESVHKTKAGEVYPVEISANYVAQGGQEFIVALARDIGQRKKAEAALMHSHDLMRYIIEHSRGSIAVHDRDLKYIYVSRRYLDEYGVKEADVIGRHHYEVFPDLPQKWRDAHQKALAGEVSSAEDDPYERQDGSVRWTRWECRPWYGADGSIGGIIVYTEDITERRRAEEVLRLTQLSVDAALDMVNWIGPDGRLVYVNHSYCDRHGYSPDELLNMSIFDLDPDLAPESWPDRWRRTKEQGFLAFEAVHRTRDGEIFPLEGSCQIVEYDGKEWNIGFLRDVSERRKAEKALRESEETFRNLFESTAVGMFRTRLDGSEMLNANEKFLEILGRMREEVIGKPSMIHWAEPAEREEMVRRLKADGRVIDFECRMLNKRGEVRECVTSLKLYPGDGVLQGSIIDITERKQAEELLRLTQFSVDRAADAIYWTNPTGRLVIVNESACRLFGYTRDELLTMNVLDLDPSASAELRSANWEKIKEKGTLSFETEISTKKGESLAVEVTLNYLQFAGREYSCVFTRDVTERKRAEKALRESEEQLRQAQKMEAVGQLAGGIAHDFNNVLTTIIGYSELILASNGKGPSSFKSDVEEIKRAAERASSLTRQILAFSRRQALRPEVLCINQVVETTELLLRRTLGGRIELVLALSPDLGLVEVDPHQVEQVLLNLAMNARDAMTDGGVLRVETSDIELGAGFCRTHPGTSPGPFVKLAVSDTGVGMDEDTRSRVFEPFFTTKEFGKGTGLGLSTVYGIIKQSGGSIFVDSGPGRGTTFKIYLPRVDRPTGCSHPATEAADSRPGSGSP